MHTKPDGLTCLLLLFLLLLFSTGVHFSKNSYLEIPHFPFFTLVFTTPYVCHLKDLDSTFKIPRATLLYSIDL